MQAPNHIPQTLPAPDFELTQAQFRALAEGWKLVLKFNPSVITMKNDVLMVQPQFGNALIMADYSKLLNHVGLSLSFFPEASVINGMAKMSGEGDIQLTLNNQGFHNICGPHRDFRIKAAPLSNSIALPVVTWLGVGLAGYSPKDIKEVVGKAADVFLMVYSEQLEQLATREMGRYTFTRGMGHHLAKRQPDVVLHSRVAFRHFGDKQSIRLGVVGKEYVLEVTNPHDMKADVVVMEQLEVLR